MGRAARFVHSARIGMRDRPRNGRERSHSLIERAIFVLTGPKSGRSFLRVLPELRDMGLSEVTILHLLSARPGPVEPMTDVANWVRHLEATIPKVELALKRGDPVKWIYELARVRGVDLVVISGTPSVVDWDLERVTSPLRSLGVPILYLPEHRTPDTLRDRVVLAVKALETLDRAVPRLREFLGATELRSIHIAETPERLDQLERAGVTLEIVPTSDGVAQALLQHVRRRNATLLAILAGEEAETHAAESGQPVVKPLVEASERPILIWPAEIARA